MSSSLRRACLMRVTSPMWFASYCIGAWVLPCAHQRLVAPGLPSAGYLSYVVCKLLHRSTSLHAPFMLFSTHICRNLSPIFSYDVVHIIVKVVYKVSLRAMRFQVKFLPEAKTLGDFLRSIQALINRVIRYLCWWEVVGTMLGLVEGIDHSKDFGESSGVQELVEGGMQIQQIHDAEPVSIQNLGYHTDGEIEASSWVKSHILELSKTYGVAFEGFREETHALLMKLDERKSVMEKKGVNSAVSTPRHKGIGKNELKNLQSDLNEEVEGARSEGESSLTLK
ncbi:hypothetical protein H5410_037750 [Solanum commersonii]|uniref:Uncharacterized protein n=1 Tax=Solanum commersonii TaxID=4109 RepID=A0A9J5YC19_SOLCO|nr:hypothetical protein H5410_037750 [Solanum commersonii]